MAKSNIEHNKLYKIVPAQKLESEALTAFKGAEYHFKKIEKLFHGPGLQTGWEWKDKDKDHATKERLQLEVNKFHWHLRAFFWELVATFDTILHWANQRYELGIPEKDVAWKEIRKKAKKAKKHQSEWVKKYPLLERSWDSEQYFEVRLYRNFAHRASLFVQGVYGTQEDGINSDSKLITLSLLPVREGQAQCTSIMEQLSIYLESIRQLGESVFKT